jgi:Kelch motif
MNGRDIERDLSDFFRDTPAPRPSDQLRESVAAARGEPVESGLGRHTIGAHRPSQLLLSLVGLAASIVLTGGLILALASRGDRFGVAGSSERPTAEESPSVLPSATSTATATAGLSDSPTATPSRVIEPLPTPGANVTFGPAGTFKATGVTSVNPTMSALLPNGKVLVVGGDTRGNASELYDPATGKFTATGPAADYHWRGTLTELADGRALLVGGFGGSDEVATAEIYDPTTGKYTATGPLAEPRFDFSTSLLHDGEVLVVGGSHWIDANGTTEYLKSAELYNPATGTFRSAGNMTIARNQPAVVTLQDGRVLIAGGMGGLKYPSLASAEIYDPATGKFTATGYMTENRAVGVPTLLQDGRVLISGGDDSMMGVQYADLYDPATGTFSKTGPEAIDRFSHTATLLRDGRVLIAGGYAGPDGVASIDPSIWAMTAARYLSATEIYDPIKGTFTRIGNMSMWRVDATATLLQDGRVLIAGGGISGTISRADLYVP